MSYRTDIDADYQWHTGEDKTVNFTIYQNGSADIDVDRGTASVQDITGWTTSFSGYSSWSQDGTALFTVAGTVTNGTAGSAAATIPRGTTSTMTPGNYYYEFSRTDSGSYSVLSYGVLTLL